MLIGLMMIGIIFFSPVREYIDIDRLLAIVRSFDGNPLAPLIFILVYIVGVIFAIPGVAITALAGLLFGFIKGSIIVIVGSNIGCQLTFFISRFIARDFVKKFIKNEGMVRNLSDKFENNGFKVMLMLRLIPIFPFVGVNYVSGLTNIRYKDYSFATFLGMLPGTLVYVFLSSSVADVRENPVGLLAALIILIVFSILIIFLKKKKTF